MSGRGMTRPHLKPPHMLEPMIASDGHPIWMKSPRASARSLAVNKKRQSSISLSLTYCLILRTGSYLSTTST
jgi:hypothetical protein